MILKLSFLKVSQRYVPLLKLYMDVERSEIWEGQALIKGHLNNETRFDSILVIQNFLLQPIYK